MTQLLEYGAGGVRLKALFVALFLHSPLWAEPVDVLMLGDSLTHGYGLPADQGLVPRMEAWLQGQGHDVTLINAGVSGDTTAGGLARIDWLLTPEIDAIVIELGANDALRGLDPVQIAENLSQMVNIAKEQNLPVLLVRVPAIGNFGATYREQYNGAFSTLAELQDIPLVNNFFASLEDLKPAELQNYMQPDGIHPNAEGVLRIVEDLGPEFAEFLHQDVYSAQ